MNSPAPKSQAAPYAVTATGSFPIMFRRGWSEWQKDLDAVIAFAKSNRFAGVDLGPLPMPDLEKVAKAGLKIGTIDLPCGWTELVHPDQDTRERAARSASEYVRELVRKTGVRNVFTVIIPAEPNRKREENLQFALDGYGRLCKAITGTGARILIEGWPGGYPSYAPLVCCPSEYRQFLKAMPSDAIGVNYDPSHLVRMGIDHVRFLREFAPYVHHVHAKDCDVSEEALYEFGNLYDRHWRYTIPGHGSVRWGQLFTLLVEAAYAGAVSIELEDGRFLASSADEQKGLSASRDFLTTT